MTSRTQQQAVALRKVADPTVGNENEPTKRSRGPKREFHPALAMGILASRWMRSFATPCHAQGASL
jgi:hypothetical protein